MPSSDLQLNIVLVFFVYGLAFYSMGLAMMLESSRSPLLAEGRVLRPLAVFGFLHGAHEWLEMFLERSEWFELRFPVQIAMLRLSLLVFSFIALIAFGLRVLQPQRHLASKDLIIAIGLVSLYLLLILVSLVYKETLIDRLWVADALARYTLAIPGAALAALALHRQASTAQTEVRRQLKTYLQWAAGSFALYSLTQAFVPALDFFPANTINTQAFIQMTGMPIQVVRAVLAIMITVSLIRATQVVEAERKRQVLAVQKARLDALEQVRHELVEREVLRRELLRHTVIAQEDERARIARELHDETAQILTGISLNLAALHGSLDENSKESEQLTRLQGLSRKMAEGIYRLVHDLRPAQLDDLGLAAALQYLADEERRRSGLVIHLEIMGARQRLDPLIETVFFRVAQEALANVSRHAHTQEASIQLLFTPQQARLRVCDQGVGFDPSERQQPPRGWGLAGMRERADSIGGLFRIQSTPGSGTVVELEAPVTQADSKDENGELRDA